MKKTHQIGLLAILLAGLAFTPDPQHPVQKTSTSASSDAAFRSNVRSHPVRGMQLTPLGVRLAYSFGL